MLLRSSLALLWCTGCATAQIVGPPIVTTPDPRESRVVVVEPFFENAGWQTDVRWVTQPLTPVSPWGARVRGSMRDSIMVPNQVTEVSETKKPPLAEVAALAAAHDQVLGHVQRLRPSWRVMSAAAEGDATVVRVVVEGHEVIESDRVLKTFAFGFGLVVWPLQLITAWPVTETERVRGTLERYEPAGPAVTRQFGFDLVCEEGLLADPAPRQGALVEGFSERLATAIVALVEEP